MKLIVGLGNPGQKYEQTRHNVGFMAADKIAGLISASPSKVRFEGLWAEGNHRGEKLAILWPQTFMNASGKSVRKAIDFFKLTPEEIVVICDDLNLPCGRLRLKASGSSGGQKGLADIIRHLGSESFPRLKIGIDRPPEGWEVVDYVLGRFNKSEQQTIDEATTQAAYAAMDWATNGITQTMTEYNSKVSAKPKGKTKPSP
ncbi:peptidyl-tRNA hydrolase [Rhodopirellula maiorica SM1]|uniref:Peptidyl-tRNA hydrolase n=1 Tax=Rhodopirellula maiorica SM1 TaxID=1265738 RepID=M5S0X0_9BACT|nr:aminoacyl-tRNA hydrolase [Rhodopirellula maiorica]EMI21282.1 peptidyl-tRNA hydrolase [Rhodopirellula maiorica SM1]